VVTEAPVLTLIGLEGTCIAEEPLADLKAAWQKPLEHLE
jgi:hypothetical protein